MLERNVCGKACCPSLLQHPPAVFVVALPPANQTSCPTLQPHTPPMRYPQGQTAQQAAQDSFMADLWRDALGFGGAVIIRRLVGIAHVADMDSIEGGCGEKRRCCCAAGVEGLPGPCSVVCKGIVGE